MQFFISHFDKNITVKSDDTKVSCNESSAIGPYIVSIGLRIIDITKPYVLFNWTHNRVKSNL